ncbi:MAG TPA: PA2779 family protein [Wenzhouxiangellaceae bacterium]|nr:PA2779 family protein [Wenzhouxiangellaceae bacterium]
MIGMIFRNALILVLLAAMSLPAHAQLVSTGDALALEAGQLEQRVEAFLLRDDVAAELAQYGISHEKAMARVANLSAAELEQVAGRIGEMPAAGDGVVVIAGVVFIVLIILEVVGVTDIFKAR